LQQRNERDLPGGADLVAGPSMRAAGHSLSSNAVE
jgi:hypothetical protein